MSKVAVIAKIPVKDDHKDDFESAFATMLDAVEAEEGTELYVLNWEVGDSAVAWVYEIYTDQAALDVHSGSDAMKALLTATGPLVSGRPELTLLEPSAGKGHEL